MPAMDCSIIICTRNRAAMLERTLVAFRAVEVPPDWRVELIVVDNGSTDATAEVVRNADHPAIRIRHVHEDRPGKSRAQNTAMAHARGEALLFTDDDVEPAANWLAVMARPLLERECDAVAGRILLAEELRRPWLSHLHEIWMAVMSQLEEEAPELVGASMGIHRSVFATIDNFDEELGPGASGFGEETLLWMQMKEAGMKIHPVHETFVIHRPDPSRLLRASWLKTASQRGRTTAYLLHHWQHAGPSLSALQACWIRAKLYLRRLPRLLDKTDSEGCPAWEISYRTRLEDPAMVPRGIAQAEKLRTPRVAEKHQPTAAATAGRMPMNPISKPPPNDAPRKHRIVVIGAGGRLGSSLVRMLKPDHELVAFDRAALDLSSARAIREALDPLDYDRLFLTGALTAVDYCEAHRDEAFAVNAAGPGLVAEISARKGAHLTYVSTDFVFDGTKETPYAETDAPRPISVYGASKLEGETRVLRACPDHLVARVSWVFGPGRPAFSGVDRRQGLRAGATDAAGQQSGCPTYTIDLVEWMAALALDPSRAPAAGLFHLCNSNPCTWRDWGQFTIDAARDAGIQIIAGEIQGIPVDSVAAFVAKRPVNSAMATEKFSSLTGIRPRGWKEALRDFVIHTDPFAKYKSELRTI